MANAFRKETRYSLNTLTNIRSLALLLHELFNCVSIEMSFYNERPPTIEKPHAFHEEPHASLHRGAPLVEDVSSAEAGTARRHGT
jgi:hypothetical protein